MGYFFLNFPPFKSFFLAPSLSTCQALLLLQSLRFLGRFRAIFWAVTQSGEAKKAGGFIVKWGTRPVHALCSRQPVRLSRHKTRNCKREYLHLWPPIAHDRRKQAENSVRKVEMTLKSHVFGKKKKVHVWFHFFSLLLFRQESVN